MIADSPAEAIQQAVYAVLSADPELTGELGAEVVDDATDAGYPRVVIGESTEVPDNTHDRFGRDSTLTLHLWSTYAGYREVNRMLRRIVQLLDHQTLFLDGHTAIAVRFVTASRMIDPTAPNPRHLVAVFRVVTAQSA